MGVGVGGMGVGGPGIGNQFISRGGMLGGLGGIGGGYYGGMGGMGMMGMGGGFYYFYSYHGCPVGSIWIRRINKKMWLCALRRPSKKHGGGYY